jgi:hypothetical protein
VPELGLPTGYYDNACVPVAVVTTAGALLDGTLGDAVALVRETKAARRGTLPAPYKLQVHSVGLYVGPVGTAGG